MLTKPQIGRMNIPRWQCRWSAARRYSSIQDLSIGERTPVTMIGTLCIPLECHVPIVRSFKWHESQLRRQYPSTVLPMSMARSTFRMNSHSSLLPLITLVPQWQLCLVWPLTPLSHFTKSVCTTRSNLQVAHLLRKWKLPMLSMSSWNKKTHVVTPFQHALTQLLSMEEVKWGCIGIMVGYCDLRSLIHANCFTGYQVAQVHAVFEIPSKARSEVFVSSETSPPTYLTYVEWFSPIPTIQDPNSLLYRVSRLTYHGQQCASIIPVDSILCSVHLFPWFGQSMPLDWNTFMVIKSCHSFHVNWFSDRHNYYLLFA